MSELSNTNTTSSPKQTPLDDSGSEENPKDKTPSKPKQSNYGNINELSNANTTS